MDVEKLDNLLRVRGLTEGQQRVYRAAFVTAFGSGDVVAARYAGMSKAEALHRAALLASNVSGQGQGNVGDIRLAQSLVELLPMVAF